MQFILNNTWKFLFITVSVILCSLLLILSLDAGNSGDEDVWQYPHAERIYDFYASFGKDTTYKSVPEMNAYGMWFETLGVAIERIFKIDDYQTLRHLMNAFMGFIGILFAGLLARKYKGWRAGVIVMVLLFCSPRFLGHSFNNPKDIPFAAMFMIGLYYIHKFILEYPTPQIKTCIKLAVAIALTIGIRAGGLLLYAYFGFFVVLYYLVVNHPKTYFEKDNLLIVKRLFICFICIVVGAFLLTIPLWPYIMKSPIQNTIQAFKDLSHFHISLRQLFEGTFQWSDVLPWYYTPKYIFMTIPIAVIIGFLIYPFIGGCKKENRFNSFFIYFACIFPVFWIAYSDANIYGGWRHALFTYPPMVVAAGLGFNAIIDICKNKYLKITATALPFLLLMPSVLHIIRNHPYEYVYFNELAGGMDKAYGNYEMDYYYHSTREATEWIIANAEKSDLGAAGKIKVASWHSASVAYFLRNDTSRFQSTYSLWLGRSNDDWDYAIFVITGMMPEQIKSEYFPPKNTVHTIDVDGKPICLILKREDKSDFKGAEFKKAGQIDSASYYLKKALEGDPYNESVLTTLSGMYMQIGQLDSAKIYIDQVLSYLPKYGTARSLLAHYYFAKDDLDNALNVCKEMIEYNYKVGSMYHLAHDIYLRKNDIKSAERILIDMIDAGQLDDQTTEKLIYIYIVQGMNEAMVYEKIYRVMAESYERRGNKKMAEMYYDMAKQKDE